MSQKICFDPKEWFVEAAFPGIRRCKRDIFGVKKEIFEGKSRFQDIRIFESPGFGRMLALDGIIQFSQSDEFIYHEMIVHPLLISHKNPKRFLVVGGGDGGVLREVSKHPLDELYMVDIDQEVVELCQKYLPFVSRGGFKDKRLKLLFADGKNFIRENRDFFDTIVVDSTDPVGPGKALFELNFYKSVYEALRKDGVAVFQMGPFLDYGLIVKGIAGRLKKLFKFVSPLRLPMPSYSSGCEYCFLLAAKTSDPAKISLKEITQRAQKRLGQKLPALKYYSPEIHQASLVMPKMWRL